MRYWVMNGRFKDHRPEVVEVSPVLQQFSAVRSFSLCPRTVVRCRSRGRCTSYRDLSASASLATHIRQAHLPSHNNRNVSLYQPAFFKLLTVVRIENALTYGCQHGKALQYLANCCTTVSDVLARQRLRSSSRHHLDVPRHWLSTYSRLAFSVAGPSVCLELSTGWAPGSGH